MNWAKRFRPTIFCDCFAKSGDWLMIIGDALVGRPRKLNPAFTG